MLPRHVAIIMDGNGRWAKKRGLPRRVGHQAGMEAVRRTIEACVELGLPALTLYVFSTENWKRPRREVDFLMGLVVHYLRKDLITLDEANVRVRLVGERGGISAPVMRAFDAATQTTGDNSGLVLGLAFNYGGRSDITAAVRALSEKVKRGELNPAEIDEELVQRELLTAGMPDPDLIIRTGGEQRLSNFLLWQAAYAELWWTDTYWPDFNRELLQQALADFERRDRRFGRVREEQVMSSRPRAAGSPERHPE